MNLYRKSRNTLDMMKALAALAFCAVCIFGSNFPARADITNSATVSGTYQSSTTIYGPATGFRPLPAPPRRWRQTVV